MSKNAGWVKSTLQWIKANPATTTLAILATLFVSLGATVFIVLAFPYSLFVIGGLLIVAFVLWLADRAEREYERRIKARLNNER